LLSRRVLGLGLVGVQSEVELIRGVRVVARGRVGVRGVVRDDLLASSAYSESLRKGSASIAEAIWEVLVERDISTRWLSSRLACNGPWGRRRRVGYGSGLEVGVLVVERNFAEFFGEVARDHFGKRHGPSLWVGCPGEAALERASDVSCADPGPEDEGDTAVESDSWLDED
jgi:hypothetical protein